MILLTGGTGFAGRDIASRLVAGGREVRVLSRKGARTSQSGALSWAQGDLADRESLRVALRDVRTVIHAAARVPGKETDVASLEGVNVAGTESLALTVRESSVRQFVHISSAGVYGESDQIEPHVEEEDPKPGTSYERSKPPAEHALKRALDGSTVGWTILRPQGLFGPDRPATAHLFREVGRRSVWLHGPSRVIVHPTHITDLTMVVGRHVDRDDLHEQVVNVGGERPLEFPDLVALIGAIVGHTPWLVTTPRWIGGLAALAFRLCASVTPLPAILARMASRVINRSVNTEKARRLLGFQPMPLAHGLESRARDAAAGVVLAP